MSTHAVDQLLRQAAKAGITVSLEAENVVARGTTPKTRETLDLLARLRLRRDELRAFLTVWPALSREAERKFGTQYALLFPLLNQQVITPQGAGILRQVLGDHLVRVALFATPGRMTTFNAADVHPLEQPLN